MRDRIHAGARPICLLLLLAGCQSYEKKPLEPEQILKSVAQRRTEVTAPGAESLTLGEATALMQRFNPRVRDARAAYETEYAFASVKTPLPNPTIEAAPTVLSGPGILAGKKHGVEGALGWAIVLGGKRRLTDDVNAIRAEAAQVDLGGVEREEYLALRREYVDLAMTGRLVAARVDLQQTTDRSLTVMRRLVQAAQATALDVREFELETFRAEAEGLGAVQREADAQSRLGGRTGVTAEAFRAAELPASPADVPALEALQQLALSDHPDLARRRAEYNVAEKELRLEYARQYPDLNIGMTYERVQGVDQYGLGVGIEIPLFDRNQPGIARAKAHRAQIRAAFESEVERRLAAIEAARRRLTAARNTFDVMQLKIAPAAELTLKLARTALEAGAADALRFLTVVRQQRLSRIEILEAEGAVYQAWSDLEKACGAPLLIFEGEPKAPGSSMSKPSDEDGGAAKTPKSEKENS